MRAVLVVALGLALGACTDTAPAVAPHIVLVVCDTLRADHLPVYGYHRDTAPALSAWAGSGLVFEQVTAPSNWTRPSMLSVFSGRHPEERRQLRPGEPFPTEVPLLAELLRDAGYETVGVSANPFMTPGLGAARGFDLFVPIGRRPPEDGSRWKHLIATGAVVERVEYVLQTRPDSDAPVFLYVHLMDPHLPYDPPEDHRGFTPPDYAGGFDGAWKDFLPLHRLAAPDVLGAEDRAQVIGLYDGEIARMDAGLVELRALVAEHLADRPVLTLLTADHGEAFGEGESGRWAHGHGTGPWIAGVPLVLHGLDALGPRASGSASVPARGRVPTRVGLVDVLPTLLDVVGVPHPPDLDGRSLLDPVPGREFIVYRAHPRPDQDELAVVRDALRAERRPAGWQLVRDDDGREEPVQDRAALAALERAAGVWSQASRRRLEAETAGTTIEVSDELRDQLEALGYLGVAVPSDDEDR